MIPRTISASSLQVWDLCPDRWVAEYMHRGQSASNSAADTGTSVHGGLEDYVQAVYIDKAFESLDKVGRKELLITFYQMHYMKTFNTTDMDTSEYKDGLALTMKWFQRTDLSDRTVLSVEKKETIQIPYNHPDGAGHTCELCLDQGLPDGQCQVAFNYIMDRLDQTGDEEYEVVDYKTIRVPLSPEDLDTKIQARAYALVVQIKYPNAKKIKVTFDLVRHEQVSLWFTRDDNIAFWRFLCSTTQNIVDTKEEEAQAKMNAECVWCIKKFTCPLVQSNADNGGIHSLTMDEKVAKVLQLKDLTKTYKYTIEALEDEIMMHAAKMEELQWQTEDGAYEVEITSQRRRQFPAHQAAEIMGPELFAQMGSMTLGNLEKIMEDQSVDEKVRTDLKSLISFTTGGLGVKIKPKKNLF